jgi:hypothetical protein
LVAAGRRPNTAKPTEWIALTNEDIDRMSNEELIRFADEILSVPIHPDTPRGKIITKITNAAAVVHDGVLH